MVAKECFVLLALVASAIGFAEYVPRAFYTIDRFGHQSDLHLVRNRRDLLNQLRFKRDSFTSVSASSSSSSSSSGGSSNFATSSSSTSGGSPQGYYDSGAYNPGYASVPQSIPIPNPGPHYAGVNTPSGSYYDQAPGPVVVSRFGETVGDAQVSGGSSGPSGSFSSTSTHVNEDGRVTYQASSGKF